MTPHQQRIPGERHEDNGRTRAVVYARSARADSAVPVEDQCVEAREYADRHDLEITRFYTDIGKSGARIEDGSELKRLLRDAGRPSRHFSVIIIQDWSRLGRGVDAMKAHLAFFRAGIDIRVCREPAAMDIQSTSHAIQRAVHQYSDTQAYRRNNE